MAVMDAKNLVATAQLRAALTAWHQDSGLTQVRAAIEVGVSQSVFNRILSGKSAASQAQAENISHALDYELVNMLAKGRDLLKWK